MGNGASKTQGTKEPMGGGRPIVPPTTASKAEPSAGGGVSGGGSSSAAASAASTSAGSEGAQPAPPPADRPANPVLDDFIFIRTVGRGSFGKVVMVQHKATQKTYALKCLKKEQVIKRKQFEHTVAERRILQGLDHPFLVNLRFAFQSELKCVW
jgi:serine/threonine protein kinase